MGVGTAGEALLKTSLYDAHVTYKDKIIPFARYLLPIQYGTDVIGEHMAVRTKRGPFDASYMGKVTCKGPDALKNLNMLLTNNYTVMAEGQARYSPICNEQGGVVDDLTMYKAGNDCYFIVVNAVNKDKGYAWMKTHRSRDVVLDGTSSQVAQLALQGPKTMDVLKKVVKEEDIPEKYYTCLFDRMVGGMKCIISKTGYIGEDGVEIYLALGDAPKMWELLVETGKDEGLIPCGLDARDTPRLEAGIPLCGHEVSNTISPKEAGLGIPVRIGKDGSIGRQAIQDKRPLTRRRVGLKVTGRGITREYQPVHIGERQVGTIISGTHYLFLGYPAAMAPVDIGLKDPGTALEVDIRRRCVAAEVVRLPFYKRQQFMGCNKQVFKM